MLSFETYLMDSRSRRFKSFSGNLVLADIFNDLISSTYLEEMIIATENGRPAMENVIDLIEMKYPISGEFDLMNNNRHRQVLGSMIRYIMEHDGYWAGKAKKLKKGSYVQTAIVYKR